ncbi:hypothetical protein FRB94_005286 [Tulasnella sp. JGI-2019a]|nr:hypothetical protein FRB94_005286 [Tulasnella sp. JGI-2019a]KAG9016176.1 hypothetical protein FRB93_011650 [Tulasnella sp. JGI-2019a]KAG9028856.1 hypothetical protein FRB95_006018 [Tulasnella sp. JGI-2019a]
MGVGGALHYAYKRFNSTVINDLWPELWFFSAWSVMVCAVNVYTDVKFYFSNQMLTVLGTVLGLVISFRTTSAYDRFWEGRKLWGNIQLASRNLGMIVWIHVPLERKAGPGGEHRTRPDGQLRAIIERKTMMNLIQAFGVSVKHYLRSEPGVYYEDLYPLLSFLPQNIHNQPRPVPIPREGSSDSESKYDQDGSLPMWNDTTNSTLKGKSHPKKRGHKGDFDPEKVLPNIQSSIPLMPARNPPQERLTDLIPFFIIFKPFGGLFRKMVGRVRHDRDSGTRDWFGKKKELAPIDSNVPLEISLFLSSYLQSLLAQGLLTPAMATGYNNALCSMQDALVNLERIRTTPIPFAYQTHLRMSVWLYLLFLPFEVWQAFKWLTVPSVIFAAFLYLGFLEIGQEIENPFNYDENDLDLDHFCLTIQRELAEITAHPTPKPDSFIFSPWNQPFAPADRRTATEILHERQQHEEDHTEGAVIQGVRQVLLKSYEEIIKATEHRDTQSATWFRKS